MFLRDGYLFNRPLREFQIHLAALDAGLPVPPLLGVCWGRRRGLLRGAIATGALDAVHLQAWTEAGAGDAESMGRRCGALFRAMHDAGIWHADLQLRNVLVASEGPYLIDFDGARCMHPVPRLQRARNLLRFRRSIEKNGVDPALYTGTLAGYGGPEPPRWLGTLYALKGALSDRIPGSGHHV
jgi:3-deoxy-D-manno-octulosonic acid kinase